MNFERNRSGNKVNQAGASKGLLLRYFAIAGTAPTMNNVKSKSVIADLQEAQIPAWPTHVMRQPRKK